MKQLVLLGSTAVFLAAAVATGSARPAPPPALLTYAAASPSRPGLCLARADGSRRVRLTRGRDSSPSWSPAGAYVAFARQTAPGRSQILVADARGKILRRFGTGLSTEPAWSPNGRQIAYASNGRIIVASTAGRTLAEISTQTLVGGPAWSPDSRRIAFGEVREIGPGVVRGIYVVNADGTGRQLLVGDATDPAWKSDGTKLAYVAYASRLTESGFVTVANIDGTGAYRLTTSREPESEPAWSPGLPQQLAFTRGSSMVVASASGVERVAVRGALAPAWRPRATLPKARRAACS